MKKAIMISEEQYGKMLESYDQAMEELKTVKGQLFALQEQGNLLNALEYGEELHKIAILEKLFEHYSINLKYQPPGQGGNYPKAIGNVLNWLEKQEGDCPKQLESGMLQALYQYQKQWFVNGFLYATAILKVC
ncbi:MAG: hypothetical protein ACRDBO_12120 [Lachnospiraceae bacterium]